MLPGLMDEILRTLWRKNGKKFSKTRRIKNKIIITDCDKGFQVYVN